jgi:hypothetical protein
VAPILWFAAVACPDSRDLGRASAGSCEPGQSQGAGRRSHQVERIAQLDVGERQSGAEVSDGDSRTDDQASQQRQWGEDQRRDAKPDDDAAYEGDCRQQHRRGHERRDQKIGERRDYRERSELKQHERQGRGLRCGGNREGLEQPRRRPTGKANRQPIAQTRAPHKQATSGSD